jgi:hypothetical protein
MGTVGLLGAQLEKLDDDFRFLLDTFASRLAAIGESELARLLERAFVEPAAPDQRLPARGGASPVVSNPDEHSWHPIVAPH